MSVLSEVFSLERSAQGRRLLLICFNPLMWKCSLEQAHLHLTSSHIAASCPKTIASGGLFQLGFNLCHDIVVVLKGMKTSLR